nr:MAG TPA: hypothetical protein [Caudoviricetes sp.]
MVSIQILIPLSQKLRLLDSRSSTLLHFLK